MKNILVLCTGNSCRSQMAEAFLNKLLKEKKINARAFSAGIEAQGLNPRAVQVMKEIGMDISLHRSKTLDEFYNRNIDLVITVCDNAEQNCPIFPGQMKKIHHSFSDPAKAKGNEKQIMDEFRRVRDEIGRFCEDFVSREF